MASPPAKRTVLALGLALLASIVPASAQDVTEPALKAAYIYNFARFTKWPGAAPSATQPFTFCVLGDVAVVDALARAVKRQDFEGRPIVVTRVSDTERLASCQVLYVSGQSSTQVMRMLEAIGDAPVLTISDSDGFIKTGGIVQLFFERGRLRFSVHQAAARRVGLHISSQVLSLARQP